MEQQETYVGDPLGIGMAAGVTPAERKLAELAKSDQEIRDMVDTGEIENKIDDLVEFLNKNPDNADALNTVNRLKKKLEKHLN